METTHFLQFILLLCMCRCCTVIVFDKKGSLWNREGPMQTGSQNHFVGHWKYFLMPQNGIGNYACGNQSTELMVKRPETKGQVWLLSFVRSRRIFMDLVILSSRVRGSQVACPGAKVPGCGLGVCGSRDKCWADCSLKNPKEASCFMSIANRKRNSG